MFVASNLLTGLATVLDFFLTAYMIILFGRVVISWVNADRSNPIVIFLHKATDPMLGKISRWLPWLRTGSLDLTPLAVFALIAFLQVVLVQSLMDFAVTLKG